MADAKPFRNVLRSAAAAFIAAAAVASCGSGEAGIQDRAVNGAASPDAPVAPDEPVVPVPEPAATAATPSIAVVPTTSAVIVDFEAVSLQGMVADAVEDVLIQAANPVTIRIPSIQVEAPIVGLGLRDDGSIEVPKETDETGWWKGGPEPGEPGPAVILGHVDSRVGPAVFYRLKDLAAGDEIHIDRRDGTTVTYVVEASERHAKDDFPTEAVYGATEQPTLRLVTCGGEFDYDMRSYKDNFVVFASMV